jgi:hypothetical protein
LRLSVTPLPLQSGGTVQGTSGMSALKLMRLPLRRG